MDIRLVLMMISAFSVGYLCTYQRHNLWIGWVQVLFFLVFIALSV